MKFIFRVCVVLLPWVLRRHVLRLVYGFQLHPRARIGSSWIFPAKLVLGEGARIGHLNVAIHLDRIELGAHATIERGNWITGFSRGDARHFGHCAQRDPALVMGAHSAITKHHHIDCTDRIEIGAFTTVAGYGSQLLTHAIDLERNRQDAAPIAIGEYCFIGTNVVILGGAQLPPRSVLGAKALLNKPQATAGWLYAGVPARPVHELPPGGRYFSRDRGFVD